MRKLTKGFLCTIAITATACRTDKDYASGPELRGLGVPSDEGVPINFVSDLPAGLAHELYRNFGNLARASSVNGRFQDIKELPFAMTCENFPGDETRCRLVYNGPEIKVKLADLLFQTMAGNVALARRCGGAGCNNPFKMWWRTKSRQDKGKQLYDFEVCQIKGAEAGIGSGERFAVLGKVLDSILGQPLIKGFSVTIEEYSRMAPKFDARGVAVLDAQGKPVTDSMRDYRVIAAQAGLGAIGDFPHPGCGLSDDDPSDVVARAGDGLGKNFGEIPASLLEAAPGRLVKVVMDVNAYVGKTSSGQTMKFNTRCQSHADQPVCEMRYQGPPLTLPVPSYVTGIFDGTVEFLRPCRNPGCRQYTEVVSKMTAYAKNGLEYIEICSLQGAEIFTKMRFPWQERIVGMPDLKGIKLALDPGPGKDDPKSPFSARKPVLKEFYMGVSNIGPFPTTNCEFSR